MESKLVDIYRKRLQPVIGSFIRVVVNVGMVRKKLMPSVWAAKFINFKFMHSARIKGPIDLELTPYLKAPIDAWDFEGTIREVTVVAPEQTGKTLAWLIGLLWSFIFKPCLSLVCYESDDKATEINNDKMKPLMEAIPELAAELSIPKTFRADRYSLSNLTSYFQGAGSRISSKSSRVNVADELDDWQDHAGQVENLKDMRKRLRSFPESILYKVCTIKGSDAANKTVSGVKASRIWSEFKNSSMGFWHLCCLNPKCKSYKWKVYPGLTMRSADVHNMQFDLDENGELIPGTCELECPICKHRHPESVKLMMNNQGDYVFKYIPRQLGKFPHLCFQWGALASFWETLCWDIIAKSQLKAGRSGRLQDQIYFDNSIRGLPFKPRKIDGKRESAIRSHCADEPPPEDTIEALFLIADTQDYGWKWEIRALDIDCCHWQIAYGFCEYLELDDDNREKINIQRQAAAKEEHIPFEPIKTFEDILTDKYLVTDDFEGISPLLGMIDEGGHRKREVAPFVKKNRRLFSYKGENRGSERVRISENHAKLLLCHEKEFKSDFLFYLYNQGNRDNHYWYLLPTAQLCDEYVAEIGALRPDPTNKAEGHLYENYSHDHRVHDYFDCCKMYLALVEFAVKYLSKKKWRQGKAEIINMPKDKDSDTEKPEETPKQSSSGWMSSFR
jgi:Phage terminase large subunit gpA, ATPase domain/Terminase large subunit gpA, endonuclease domain